MHTKHIGCPLIHDKDLSERDFVDWVKVREILTKKVCLIKNNPYLCIVVDELMCFHHFKQKW